jgi:hypothetical protein
MKMIVAVRAVVFAVRTKTTMTSKTERKRRRMWM